MVVVVVAVRSAVVFVLAVVLEPGFEFGSKVDLVMASSPSRRLAAGCGSLWSAGVWRSQSGTTALVHRPPLSACSIPGSTGLGAGLVPSAGAASHVWAHYCNVSPEKND